MKERSGKRHSTLAYSLIVALLAAVVVVGTVCATVGIMTMRNDERQTPTAQLTTRVSRGTIEQTATGTLEALPHDSTDVTANGTVTRNGVTTGTQVNEGTVIAVINERPIIMLQGSVPMFRDLGSGVSGNDVKQLQEALKRLGHPVYDAAGSYGRSTALAVFRLYGSLGFPPVDATGHEITSKDWANAGVPAAEMVFAPQFPLIAAQDCGTAGQQVTGLICRMNSAARDYIIAFPVAQLADAGNITGKSATAQLGEPLQGTVGEAYRPQTATDAANIAAQTDGSAGGAANGSAGKAPDSTAQGTASGESGDEAGGAAAGTTTGDEADTQGSVSYYHFTTPDPSKLPADPKSAQVRVIIRSSQRNGFTVPSVALEATGGKRYHLTTDGGKKIPVTVGFCHEGQCAISGGKLTEGMKVRIPDGAQLTGTRQ